MLYQDVFSTKQCYTDIIRVFQDIHQSALRLANVFSTDKRNPMSVQQCPANVFQACANMSDKRPEFPERVLPTALPKMTAANVGFFVGLIHGMTVV